MYKSVKHLLAATVSLAVAGTCLAAPAFAADSSALGSALDAVAQAAEQANSANAAGQADGDDTLITLGNHMSFAGLAFDAPEGFTSEEDESGLALELVNEDENAAISIYDLREAETPEGVTWEEYFPELVAASVADYPDATIEDLGSGAFDGSDEEAYAYGIIVPDGDDVLAIVQIYMPMGDGFTFVQVGYSDNEATDALKDELTDFIDSIVLADDDGLDIDSLQTSACGLTFDLPEGVAPYEDDEDAWMDEDGDILIKAVGHVAEGASKMTGDDFAELYAALEPEGDSPDSTVELIDQGTIDGQGDIVSAYNSYKVTDPDETMYAVVVVTPIPSDDSISVVIYWCTEAGSEKYGEAIAQMIGTFAEE